MSGWIDPLGTRALHRFIEAEQNRLGRIIDESYRLHPRSRRLSKYRARYAELGKLQALVLALERPGKELLQHKALVNVAGRRDLIDAIVPRNAIA